MWGNVLWECVERGCRGERGGVEVGVVWCGGSWESMSSFMVYADHEVVSCDEVTLPKSLHE